MNKVDMDSDCLDYEILWEDLTIGEQIGQGSCGTVYHGLWFGSDVAVKVFSKQEYSEEIITSFKQEVLLFSVASLSMFGKRLLELVFVLSE
jgi:serine/threonine protein kinase